MFVRALDTTNHFLDYSKNLIQSSGDASTPHTKYLVSSSQLFLTFDYLCFSLKFIYFQLHILLTLTYFLLLTLYTFTVYTFNFIYFLLYILLTFNFIYFYCIYFSFHFHSQLHIPIFILKKIIFQLYILILHFA